MSNLQQFLSTWRKLLCTLTKNKYKSLYNLFAQKSSSIISSVAILAIIIVCYAVFITEIVNLMVDLGIMFSIKIVVVDELTEIVKMS